ncbi:MAG: hypothetical protein KDK65_07140, partial [Chlamydiia bacterium]|nr:hypothetical protein [Chlamydiia bacterium]
TRFIALTLLIPLFVICVQNWRERKTLPFAETITLIFGIVLHFSWKVFVLWIQETSTNPIGFNFSPAFERFTHFNLAENLWLIADFFFYIHLIEKEPGLLSILIGGTTLGILLQGFFSRQRRPSDWYALGTLVVVFFFRWKFSRYLLPITPFLFSYLFSGLRSFRPLAPLWISAFLILNGIYLAIGNGGRTYNSMNPWLLGDRPFYGGIWRETDQVCQSLSGQPKIRVVSASHPRDFDKYVHYFSHCEITEDPTEADFTLSINELASGTSEVFLY